VLYPKLNYDDGYERYTVTIRTDRSTITFKNPFHLKVLGEIQPAGEYVVETDNELIEGISRLAYRRVATLLTIPCLSSPQTLRQRVTVDQTDLDAALMHDRHQTM
jgi:hypothetical protein